MTGIVTLSGLIVLSYPRCVDESRGNRNLLLDADIWCDDVKHSDSPSVGLFRYFNTRNYSFEKTFTVAFATVNVAKMDDKIPAEFRSDGMEFKDYAYIGDILQLIPVNDSIHPDENPFIFLAGAVMDANNNDHTFEMLPNQYINIMHDSFSFPAHCIIPDSPKYGADNSRKPKPAVGGFVAVGGFLKEVVRNDNEEIMNFGIQVENVTFLGRMSSSPVTKRRGSIISSNRPISKRRFNFNQDLESQNKQPEETDLEEQKPASKNIATTSKGGRNKGKAKD